MDVFLNRVTPLRTSPGQVLQEVSPKRAVVLGGDGSKCVTAPEAIPGGQDVEVGDN